MVETSVFVGICRGNLVFTGDTILVVGIYSFYLQGKPLIFGFYWGNLVFTGETIVVVGI